jgi:hypothetical protein
VADSSNDRSDRIEHLLAEYEKLCPTNQGDMRKFLEIQCKTDWRDLLQKVIVELMRRERELLTPAHCEPHNPDSPKPGSWPRWWRLFSFVLPRSTRDRVFEPSFQELMEDYLATRGAYRTKWARRWLKFCFTLRTALMVGSCLRAWITDRGVAALLWFLPGPVREWVTIRWH